jgi:2-polyprenyl-3-methyl-5-hydroxy-6-metoxy-1,4-benzoquinol methylase
MNEQKDEMIEVLKFNKGFTDPERWIEYGIVHKFKKIKAEKLEGCPDCSARSIEFIGQFVYYSTMVNLQACTQCGLVFTDTRIDPNVISSHFEQAYKDEEYFLHRRRRIFEQISRLAASVAPRGGRILDVGGAKGHLLATLKRRRPDLDFILNDLSKEACDHAESKYGFQTILGGINELEQVPVRFDVIILSDVIYYEPDLRKVWAVLPGLISENGTIIIRVPNKLALIRSWQFMSRAISRLADKEMQDNIKFFNPEHLFVFCRSYLSMRLKSLGFEQVIAIPSELLAHDRKDWWHPFFYYLCKILWIISFNKIVITPSLLVVAKK